MDSYMNLSTDKTLPSTKEKIEWLRNRMHESIGYMQETRNINRRKASILKITTILISGVGSILLGLQISGFESIFRNVAFILVTIVTLVNALEPFFNYRALWIEKEQALAGLRRIQEEFEFYLAGIDINNVDKEKLDQIYRDFREVWNQHNNAWLAHRRADTPGNYIKT